MSNNIDIQPIYSYDQALKQTVEEGQNKSFLNSLFGSNIFQQICFLTVILGQYSTNPVISGLAFLEKEPHSFECFYSEQMPQQPKSKMENSTKQTTSKQSYLSQIWNQQIPKEPIPWEQPKRNDISNKILEPYLPKSNRTDAIPRNGFWRKCTKQDICEHKPYGKSELQPLKARPNITDGEYLDNWVEKLGLLCETKQRIGMLGSAFFIGILCAMMIVPKASDLWGRKYLFVLTMTVSLTAQVGLIRSESLNASVIYMIMIGSTFPGKNVVGLNYLLEFVPENHHTKYVTFGMILDCLTLYGMSYGFQKYNRNWLWTQVLGLAGTSFALVVSTLLMPESPKFLYIKKRYEEARQSLYYVSNFNNGDLEGKRFLFVEEYEALIRGNHQEPCDERCHLIPKKPSQTPARAEAIPLQTMSDSQYNWNVFKMIVIWTTTVFSTYLIMFQLKYLRGNIFQNTNSYSISDAFSRIFGGIVYESLGLRKSFILAYTIAMVGGICIYFIQCGNAVFEFQRELPIEQLMPVFTMVTKFGLGAAMLSCYSACYSDDHIFPLKKRATAIGICNIVARSITILAPQVNELKAPLPMLTFIAIIAVAFIASFSFIAPNEMEQKPPQADNRQQPLPIQHSIKNPALPYKQPDDVGSTQAPQPTTSHVSRAAEPMLLRRDSYASNYSKTESLYSIESLVSAEPHDERNHEELDMPIFEDLDLSCIQKQD